jgi:hypothetical protein
MEAGFYEVAAVGSFMGTGVSDAKACTLAGVVKLAHPSAPYTVANEYICGRLATAIGLPTPPGTIAKMDDGTLAYVMLRFGLKGDKPPPADPPLIASNKARLAAGVVVFDDWILNADRHPANMAYVPDAGLSIFDHGHALLGTTDSGAVAHLTAKANTVCLGGALAPHLSKSDDLFRWASRIRQVDDELVREFCDTPRRLGAITKEESAAASAILIARKSALWQHVHDNQANFPAVTDWGLTA